MTLLTKATAALQSAELSISSTRRSGQNGLRNADEVAKAVLDAIEAEEMLRLLMESQEGGVWRLRRDALIEGVERL